MTTLLGHAPVRRALTIAEIDIILARIAAANSTGELLAEAVAAVYDPLLADAGLSWQTLPAEYRIDPRQFSIPSSQWQAITAAVSSRAAQWGTGPELSLEMINVLPGSHDDPDAAVPAAINNLPDRRPDMLELHVTRDAADVIAAATDHVRAISVFFGPESTESRRATASWMTSLSRLFSMSFGADTRVRRDGNLSLLITTGSGFVYALIFHGDTRRCTAGDGCTALIDGNGNAHTISQNGIVAEHEHQPSFPLDAPRPGSWSLHS